MQVGEHVRLVVIVQRGLVRGHSAAALIDLREHTRITHRAAIFQRLPLEQPLHGGTYAALSTCRIVALSTHISLKYLFALGRIARTTRANGRCKAKRQNARERKSRYRS